jgi:hypothetical protein
MFPGGHPNSWGYAVHEQATYSFIDGKYEIVSYG